MIKAVGISDHILKGSHIYILEDRLGHPFESSSVINETWLVLNLKTQQVSKIEKRTCNSNAISTDWGHMSQ